jgi:rhodanese-related sulfurtransferase
MVTSMSIREVTVEELETVLAQGARLIDVREVDEYVAGHVAGALLVALSTVPDHVDEFRGDSVAYVICKSGGRSMRACEFLAANGIETINVAGGTMAWVMSGRPVVDGDQPT